MSTYVFLADLIQQQTTVATVLAVKAFDSAS